MSVAARRVLVVDVPAVAAAFSRRLGTLGLKTLTDPTAIGEDERLVCALLDLAADGLRIARGLLVRQPELRVAFLTSGADSAIVDAGSRGWPDLYEAEWDADGSRVGVLRRRNRSRSLRQLD